MAVIFYHNRYIFLRSRTAFRNRRKDSHNSGVVVWRVVDPNVIETKTIVFVLEIRSKRDPQPHRSNSPQTGEFVFGCNPAATAVTRSRAHPAGPANCVQDLTARACVYRI